MENPIYNLIQTEKAGQKNDSILLNAFTQVEPAGNRVMNSIKSDRLFYLTFDVAILKDLASFITISIPFGNENIIVELLDVSASLQNYSVVTGDEKNFIASPNIKHYRGIIQDEETSVVAITFLDEKVMGLISTSNGNFNLAYNDESSCHILYNDKDFIDSPKLICRTDEDIKLNYDEVLLLTDSKTAFVEGSKCVKFYLETEYEIFQSLGSVSAVEGFITGLMNQVGLLYFNENILTSISQIRIWNTPDPYSSTNVDGLLQEFQANTSLFNGDLGHLLTFRSIGGGKAAGFSGLCNSNVDNKLAVSMIFNFYSQVPNYSWSVYVITHEFGHLMGSRHTHACVWNGNNTAIDGCAGFTEGGCTVPPIPSGGGTIMSYCHQLPVGINFNLGFGPQPGNVIRNSFNSAACLSPCFAIDGPNVVCNSGNYSISNLPSGSTVTWNATPVGIATLVPSGNTVTLNKVGNGSIVLDASINLGGAVFTATSRSIIVGIVPIIPTILSSGYYNSESDPYNLVAVVCAPAGNRTVMIDFNGVQNLTAVAIYGGGNYPQVVNTTVYWVYPNYGSGYILLFQYDGPCGRVSQRITFQNSCP